MEDLDNQCITSMGGGGQSKNGYMFNKRKQKQNSKEHHYEEKRKPKQLGAEQLISVLSKVALPILRDLPIIKSGLSYDLDLKNLMMVECTMDSLLLYGRYIKLSREVSQTPWVHGTKKLVRD